MQESQSREFFKYKYIFRWIPFWVMHKIKILTARLRGETVEEIAKNLGVDVEQVQKVLNSI